MRTNQSTRTTMPRKGPAFLSRLLTCGQCGYRMNVHYGRGKQRVARGQYQCRTHDFPTRMCHSVNASYVDPPVIRAVLQTLAALTPQTIAEALAQEQHGYLQHQQQHAHTVREAEAAVTPYALS